MADIKHDDNLIEMDDTPAMLGKMSRLTNQEPGSGFYKLMDAILARSRDYDAALEKMNVFHSLEYLSGKALDYFGEQFNVYRAGATDDYFKFKIRAAMVAATADGTTDSIIKAVSYILGCEYSDVRIEQPWQTGGEARTINIAGLPFNYANDPNAVKFLAQQLTRSVEATTRIVGIEFSHTDEQSLYIGSTSIVQERYVIQNRGVN
ncbi:MAG: hypothetical protein SOH70_03785 [Lentilactobacillus sunkii]|jgi:hypothetical protein|uniref:hypothetical protein n=1 Tax=Lentilactobacillus sunkii TaxID=481719 RepID=UPI002F35D4DA